MGVNHVQLNRKAHYRFLDSGLFLNIFMLFMNNTTHYPLFLACNNTYNPTYQSWHKKLGGVFEYS